MKAITKKAVPIFLALVFLGSVLAVFTYGGEREETGKMKLIINFGTPDKIYEQELSIIGNQSALRILTSYAAVVEVKSGEVDCISDYCNTPLAQWKFYTVQPTLIGGYEETALDVTPERYIVKKGEIIMFRYERTPVVVSNGTVLNQTV